MSLFTQFILLDRPVLSYRIENDQLYLLSGREIAKYDLKSDAISRVEFFQKDGLSRRLLVDADYLYCADFTMLYIFDKETLSCCGEVKLGEDLTSDICGMDSDDKRVYAGIRNGSLAVIDKASITTKPQVEFYEISSSSMWVIRSVGDKLYAGNVEGHLLVIDKQTCKVVQDIAAHRQNLKSLLIYDNRLLSASQDKSFAIRNLDTLDVIAVRKSAHRKAFRLAGIWKDVLITTCFPCGEIKLWDLDKLEAIKSIPIAACNSGQLTIYEDCAFLASRGIDGLERVAMDRLLQYDRPPYDD